jgi:hypothetical protein
MRRLLGVFLMVDGAVAVWGFTTLVESLASRDAASVVAIVARAAVGALAASAGWLLTQRRPPGELLAAATAIATALLVTIGTLWRLIPTNLDPTFRVHVVTFYWLSALVIVVYTVTAQRKMLGGAPE